MIEAFVQWVVATVGKWGYPGITIMMAIESSFIPFPSEVVMIPAGYLVYKGQMEMPMAVGAGVVGSLVGALVNYALACLIGRTALHRYGKYLFISEKNLVKAEKFFIEHGEVGTFVGRLIPVIRQYISLPAGLARMNIWRFMFYTGLGAGIWTTVLAWIGYLAGGNEHLVRKYWRYAVAGLLVICIIIVVCYVKIYRNRIRNRSGIGSPQHSK
jgi:membrane protein DedA with SNARE-associated domain